MTGIEWTDKEEGDRCTMNGCARTGCGSYQTDVRLCHAYCWLQSERFLFPFKHSLLQHLLSKRVRQAGMSRLVSQFARP